MEFFRVKLSRMEIAGISGFSLCRVGDWVREIGKLECSMYGTWELEVLGEEPGHLCGLSSLP